ncbi:Protein of unknown function [Pseudomonas guineae]|uniref:DUF3703 domain-containing protein n=1 Tax=Pseudomonas guineae TaxID=425504 RepID=A0A1I3E697_9PSED|nr:DUF3703 domain-containing protein [Pseudomonas guineae]SFH94389.1 Protein of unknown function [Pseudomonas guineae]
MTRKQAFWQEQQLARAQRGHDPVAELRHLERAHILGQRDFREHLRSHLWLLAWAWRQRDWAECGAQLLRIPGSLGSLVGVYPLGNPGTRRVGALTPQPLSEDLQVLLK